MLAEDEIVTVWTVVVGIAFVDGLRTTVVVTVCTMTELTAAGVTTSVAVVVDAVSGDILDTAVIPEVTVATGKLVTVV